MILQFFSLFLDGGVWAKSSSEKIKSHFWSSSAKYFGISSLSFFSKKKKTVFNFFLFF